MLKTLLLVSLVQVAVCQLRCATEADTLSSPVFISNEAALNARVAGSGSAVFDFGSATGSFWAKTRCPTGSSDSWFVNGQVWHVPQSTNTFRWNRFGATAPLVNLVPREAGCQIQAVYFGSQEPNTLADSCDTYSARGYLASTEFIVSYPVFLNANEKAINSVFGTPLAGNGAAILNFDWPASFGSANLWLLTKCPTENSNSWFVNNNRFEIRTSSEYTWNRFGSVNSATVELKPREVGCLVRAAYLGRDTPSDSFAYPLNLFPSDTTKCPSEASQSGNLIRSSNNNIVEGSCFHSPTNAATSGCLGTVSFDLGNTRGAIWAYTKCENGNSDSWFVNGDRWNVPISSTWQWNRYGNLATDTSTVTFTTREPGCEISMVFRGYGAPVTKTCPNSALALSTQCEQNVNCFHGTCTDNNSWCKCYFYAFGCECTDLWSGVPSTPELCSFETDITSTPAYEIKKPVDEPYSPRAVSLYYSEPRAITKVIADTLNNVVVSQTVCKENFVNANGLAVDEDEGVYVADTAASQLLYVNPVCGNVDIVIPQNHFIATPADVEILHGHGRLVVASWGRPGVYYVELNANHQLVRYSNTGATNLLAHGLSQCVDKAGNDGFFFVEQGYRLVFFDVKTKTRTTVIEPSQAQRIADIADVEYRACGIFFTANDNMQVWQCTADPNNELPGYTAQCNIPHTHCRKLCDKLVDSSACEFLQDPTGLAVDCQCNVFTGNKGNGNLVLYPRANSTGVRMPTTATVYANDIDLFGPSVCGADLTPPVVTLCGRTNNPQDQQVCVAGQTITITVTSDEKIYKPSVSCGVGATTLPFAISGADFQTSYTLTYTVQAGDPTGTISCVLTTDPVDVAGNNGTWTYSVDSSCVVAIVNESPSMTPTRTTSQTPSRSITPTPTPSMTASRSPTPSVTPSVTAVLVSLSSFMGSDSGSCQSGSCAADSLDIARAIAFIAYAQRIEIAVQTAAACTGDGSNYSAGLRSCTTALPFTNLTRWAIEDFDIYKESNTGAPSADAFPPYYVRPAVYPSDTYPNRVATSANPFPLVAGALNCTLFSRQDFFFVWRRPQSGPCYLDPEYNIEVCVPNQPGASFPVSQRAFLFNRSQNVLDRAGIVLAIKCPFVSLVDEVVEP